MDEPQTHDRRLTGAEVSRLISATLRQMAGDPAALREIVADALGSADDPAMGELTDYLRARLLEMAGAQGHLSSDDAVWFAEQPHREFRCRHLTDAERLPEDVFPLGSDLVTVIYVRRSDGATVKAWTPFPDRLIAEEDEGTARFAAQALPNPPALGILDRGHVEVEPVPPETAAYLISQIGPSRPQ